MKMVFFCTEYFYLADGCMQVKHETWHEKIIVIKPFFFPHRWDYLYGIMNNAILSLNNGDISGHLAFIE